MVQGREVCEAGMALRTRGGGALPRELCPENGPLPFNGTACGALAENGAQIMSLFVGYFMKLHIM